MSTVIEVDAITMVDDPDNLELTEVTLLNVSTEVAKFDPVKQALSLLTSKISTTTYDCNTTTGEETARGLRAQCVKIRTTGDRVYKMLNAPLLEVQRKWRDANSYIASTIKPYEDKLDADIKAVEAVREAEKQRKIQADQDRINALRTKITAIAVLPTEAAKAQTIEQLRTIVAVAQATVLDQNTFGEFLEEAALLHGEVSTQLAEMFASATAREEQAAQLTREAAEFEVARKAQALAATRASAIVAIRSYVLTALGMNSLALQAHIEDLSVPTAAEFGDSLAEAVDACKLVIQQLEKMLMATQAQEQLTQEQELAREQDAARRQADTAASEQRQLEAAAATKLLREQTDAFEKERAEARAQVEADSQLIKEERKALEQREQELSAPAPSAPSPTPELEAPVIGTGTALPAEVTLTPQDHAKERAARLVKLLMDDSNDWYICESATGAYMTEFQAINYLLDSGVQWALTERKLALEAKAEGVTA